MGLSFGGVLDELFDVLVGTEHSTRDMGCGEAGRVAHVEKERVAGSEAGGGRGHVDLGDIHGGMVATERARARGALSERDQPMFSSAQTKAPPEIDLSADLGGR